MKLSPQGPAFAMFLGTLAALPPLSIDMPLPALVSQMHALSTNSSLAGLTMSLFMAAFAASPIIYGPLSDRYGRRPVLLAGLLLFAIGRALAASAGSIGMLLVARLVQGAGAGVGMTLAFAIVRDLFEGRAARTRLAAIAVVANVAPIIAPTIGAALLGWVGWRGIYGVIALSGVLLLCAVVFGLRETKPPGRPAGEALLPRLVRDYRNVLGHGDAMAHIIVNGLGFAWMFAYVTGSPLVSLDEFHLRPAVYGALFACTGSGIVAGALLNGRLARYGASARGVLGAAILLAVTTTITLVVLTATERQVPLAVLMPLLVLTTACFGLATPSASHGALAPLPDVAGIAGGLLTSVQMLAGAGASLLVALLFPLLGTVAMTGVMALSAIGASLVFMPNLLRRSLVARP
jgi:MFS transporter, DHA1 family, multidrug resistance protein